jgi:hypothetical protein
MAFEPPHACNARHEPHQHQLSLTFHVLKATCLLGIDFALHNVQLIILAGLQGFKATLAGPAKPFTSQQLQQKHVLQPHCIRQAVTAAAVAAAAAAAWQCWARVLARVLARAHCQVLKQYRQRHKRLQNHQLQAAQEQVSNCIRCLLPVRILSDKFCKQTPGRGPRSWLTQHGSPSSKWSSTACHARELDWHCACNCCHATRTVLLMCPMDRLLMFTTFDILSLHYCVICP